MEFLEDDTLGPSNKARDPAQPVCASSSNNTRPQAPLKDIHTTNFHISKQESKQVGFVQT